MKKGLSFVLVVVIVSVSLLLAFGSTQSIYAAAKKELDWKIDSTGLLIISGSGNMEGRYGTLYSNGRYYSSRPWGGETNCNRVNRLQIMPGVTSIGDNAFYGFRSLEIAITPRGLCEIGRCAFFECVLLKTIVIFDGVSSIGDFAFQGCEALTSVVIPKSVSSLGNSIFLYCTNLTDIYYTGTEEEWNGIANIRNAIPRNTTIHFSYVVPTFSLYYEEGEIGQYEAYDYIKIPALEDKNDMGATQRFYTWEGANVIRGDYDIDSESPNGREYSLLMPDMDTELTPIYVTIGDVNLDDCITIKDLHSIKKILAGAIVDDDKQYEACDINLDGAVSLRDLSDFKKIIA